MTNLTCPCRWWLQARKLGIVVRQHLEELLDLYECLPDKVEHVLEVGTYQGGWLFMLASLLEAPARFCAVDHRRLPQVDTVTSELQKLGHGVSFIRASQSNAESQVRKWLGDARLDVLHLDGPHDYKGVRQGWDLYAPLVRPGGIVAIHDVAGCKDPGAQRFFEDLHPPYKTRLCRLKCETLGGIGVVFMV